LAYSAYGGKWHTVSNLGGNNARATVFAANGARTSLELND